MSSAEFWMLALVIVLTLVVVGLPWFLTRRRQSGPWDATEEYLAAIDALIRGNKQGALEALQRVAREETENVYAYLRLGDLVRSMGHPAKAHKIHASLSARSLESKDLAARVRASLLEDLVALERWDEVIESATEIRGRDKKNEVALQALVEAHRRQGSWAEAFAALDEWERVTPGGATPRPPELRVEAARSQIDAGKPAEARPLLEEAIALGSNAGSERVLLGDVYAETDDHEKAAGLWMEFAEAHPDRADEVFGRLERSYYEMGQFGDLVEVYEGLIERSSDSTAAEIALAEMHKRRGRPEEAIRLLQAVVAHDADHHGARRLLIGCYLQADQSDAALEEVDALLRDLPIGSPREAPPLANRSS